MHVRENWLAGFAAFGFAVLLSACSSSSTSPVSPSAPPSTGNAPFNAQTFLQPFAARTDLLEFQNSLLSANPPGPNANCPSTVTVMSTTYSVKWNYALQGIPPADVLNITGCDIGIYVGPAVKGVATINGTQITGDGNTLTGVWIDGPGAQAFITNLQIQGVTAHSSVKCTSATCVVSGLHVMNGPAASISAVGLRAEGGTNIYATQLQTDGYTDRGFLCVASQCGISNSTANGPSFTNPNPAVSPIGFEFVLSVITNVDADSSAGDGTAAKGYGFATICSVDSNGNPAVAQFFAGDANVNNNPSPVFVFNSFTGNSPNTTPCNNTNGTMPY